MVVIGEVLAEAGAQAGLELVARAADQGVEEIMRQAVAEGGDGFAEGFDIDALGVQHRAVHVRDDRADRARQADVDARRGKRRLRGRVVPLGHGWFSAEAALG